MKGGDNKIILNSFKNIFWDSKPGSILESLLHEIHPILLHTARWNTTKYHISSIRDTSLTNLLVLMFGMIQGGA